MAKTNRPSVNGGAILSEDRRYRYTLFRQWADGSEVAFIGLNPSTADETTDDATIRRCVGFAKSWGHGAMLMLNLFAYRATDPKELTDLDDRDGPDNDGYLLTAANLGGLVVAAWGAIPSRFYSRAVHVVNMFPTLHCLGETKIGGHPRHPLYMPKTATPQPFTVNS